MPKEIALPAYDRDRCFLFALGRNAIYAACRSLGLKPGDEVLSPAFDCDGTLQPFKVSGIKLNFFRSDPYTFSADIDDIKKRIGPKTKLIHIINHFGMPQPWDRLLAFRKECGIPILEDCAYSLFSNFRGKSFGSFGDMAIFSLRKNLPLIDGGMLRINSPKYSFVLRDKNVPLFYRSETANVFTMIKAFFGYYKAPEALKKIMRKLNPSVEPPPPLSSEPEEGYPNWPLRDHIGEEFTCDYLRPISRLARGQLEGLSLRYYEEISTLKRRYYMSLADNVSSLKGITVLWPVLPEGTAPFCLSILIESGRDRVFGQMRKKYDVMAWPTLPQDILNRLDDYPDVELLGRRIFQINLPPEKVRKPDFPAYLDRLTADLVSLLEAR